MDKILIGVTGRAGSGKTLFCSFLKESGWKVIEADRIGWKILEREDIKKQLVSVFGRTILRDGRIHRKKLGRIVFTDIEKLNILNSIVHPPLLEELKRKIEDFQRGILVVDAALIPHWGIENWFDIVVLIKSNLWKEHLKEKNVPEEIIQGLEKIQAKIDNFYGENVRVIENNGTVEELKRKAEKFVEEVNEVWIPHLHKRGVQ